MFLKLKLNYKTKMIGTVIHIKKIFIKSQIAKTRSSLAVCVAFLFILAC